jgi:hypothetical protein
MRPDRSRQAALEPSETFCSHAHLNSRQGRLAKATFAREQIGLVHPHR